MQALPTEKLRHIANCDLFIFDLDGTLYDQKKLRKKIGIELLKRLLTFRIGIQDLVIIYTFRRQREKHHGFYSPILADEQYDWCASILNISSERVKKTIEYWIYKFPIPYLLKTRFSGVIELFSYLREIGKKVVIYSDYPVAEKLNALQLTADKMYSATDKEISQLKPSAKAIQWICDDQGVNVDKAILIGDRDETDGESARLAGAMSLIIYHNKSDYETFFSDLLKQLKPYASY